MHAGSCITIGHICMEGHVLQ
uniref:Uncharacterized protein n=1 Tax=Anguilla anguilla TaxID=7936 RepID=A0A0E9QY12_ANGAN